ncbi:MAG TPA: ATP-binding protein [Solirubrobacteraceae bacterium]
MEGNWWSNLGKRGANVVVGAVALILTVVLVLFGLQLHTTQTEARQGVESRFRDRAQVVSALTQAILGSVATPSEATRQYGTPTVSGRLLDGAVAQGHLAYEALLDRQGRVIAASRTFTASIRARALSSAVIKPILAGTPVFLSDVLPGNVGTISVIDLAVSLKSASGPRVLLIGAPVALLSPFLGSYLQRVPVQGGTAYVLDSRGNVIGSPDSRQVLGGPVNAPGLVKAAHHKSSGTYGPDGYFVSVTVPGTTWRVVLTSAKSSLFSSVSGSRKWLPWVIYIALVALALGFLAVLRRLLGSAMALSAANAQLGENNSRLESSNALLRHAAELSRSNAELEQFASIASHDLQEPLRKVQTFAAQLTATEHDRLSAEGQDFLRRMSDAAGRMRTLIDDLLMFSRVSTKGRPFVAVDLEALTAQVLVDLEQSLEDSGARVSIGALPTVEADPVQMRQLLQNLLGNALKFRREDVALELQVSAKVADGLAELKVMDNGIGFDAQYATRIFRAFERLHGARTYPGTGMGLALCRKIVERHRGTIHADSEIGQGTTFTVRLPVEQPAESTPATSMFPETSDGEANHALV